MRLRLSELDRSRELLTRLGFEHVPDVLVELVERSVREKLSMLKFLDLVAGNELEFRDERRVKILLKSSGLPLGKTLDCFDFAFQRGVEKPKVDLLATCEFVKRKENCLFLGPPGTGKTHIASGLGVKAAQNGYSVAFMTADDLVEMLRRDDAVGSRKLLRRKYMTASVLIIDELGFQALDRSGAHLFFKVISHRYERGSTVITSNKGIREWPDMLAGDEVLATAILDRLLHHCHVVQIDGRSFRLKDLDLKLSEGGEEPEGRSGVF